MLLINVGGLGADLAQERGRAHSERRKDPAQE
jgi:hypothetical protein